MGTEYRVHLGCLLFRYICTVRIRNGTLGIIRKRLSCRHNARNRHVQLWVNYGLAWQCCPGATRCVRHEFTPGSHLRLSTRYRFAFFGSRQSQSQCPGLRICMPAKVYGWLSEFRRQCRKQAKSEMFSLGRDAWLLFVRFVFSRRCAYQRAPLRLSEISHDSASTWRPPPGHTWSLCAGCKD